MAQTNRAATAVQNLFKTPELKDKILFTLLCLSDLPDRRGRDGARHQPAGDRRTS